MHILYESRKRFFQEQRGKMGIFGKVSLCQSDLPDRRSGQRPLPETRRKRSFTLCFVGRTGDLDTVHVYFWVHRSDRWSNWKLFTIALKFADRTANEPETCLFMYLRLAIFRPTMRHVMITHD